MSSLSQKHYFWFQFPSPKISSWKLRYGFAVAASLFALLLSRWITPLVNYYLFDLFQGAIVLSSWYGGLGPGIVTSSLSILALDYFFMPPYHAFSVGMTDFYRLTVFGAVALLTSTLSSQLKQAKLEVEMAHEKLEERITQRTQELSQANANLTAEIDHRVEAEKAILEISNREQRRLGQDLHDGLCQILAGVKLLSGELKGDLRSLHLPQARDVEMIEFRLSEALTQADTVSRGLYPVALETNGLMAALEEMAVNVSKTFPITCRFKCPKPVFVIDSSIATHVYRIAHEAVMNSMKGGKAKHVTVKLVTRAPRIILSITDDGIGLNHHAPRKGMGLKIMEYRARMINATLGFKSRAHGWTRVMCAFPLPDTGDN